MFKRILIALFAGVAISALICSPVANSQSMRTFNSPKYPMRLLAKQFNGSTEVFTTTDPSPDGTPLTLTSATGISGADGSVTVILQSGFTAPVTLTAYEWNQDFVTPANSCWVRVAPAATGTDVYSKAIDTHYALAQFAISEKTPFLIMSSGAITGNVYIDAKPHSQNANSATGHSGYGQ